MTLELDIHGINARPCETDNGDYVLNFYHRDHSRDEVRDAIPDNYTISHREQDEGGELVIWFLEQDY